MDIQAETTATPVSMTARAALRIAEILKTQPDAALLRIGVLGGGCSGFQYTFDLDKACNEDDVIIARDGVEVAIDPVSIEFLSGSQIDYVDDLIGASFQIKNPNAVAACGCGTSFSV